MKNKTILLGLNDLNKDFKIMEKKSNKLYHDKFSEKVVYTEIKNLYKSILYK